MEWMYYRPPSPGAIRLQGHDRKAFLQEMTSNDLAALRPEQAVITVLTNAAGRILDVLIVLEDDDALLALTLPGRCEATLAYLQQHIAAESKSVPLAAFRKAAPRYDVTLSDESRLWEQALLLPGDQPPPPGLEPPHHAGHAQRFPNGSAAISLPSRLGGGLWLLNPKGVTVMMVTRTRLLGDEAYAVQRVRRGILSPEHELTAEFSPFEVGLGELVALNKEEDFPGRRVLTYEAHNAARLRRLVGLRLSAPVHLPAFVRHEETQVGRVTSAVVDGSVALALAAVRPPHHALGNRLTVRYTSGVQEHDAQAVVLPLPMPEGA